MVSLKDNIANMVETKIKPTEIEPNQMNGEVKQMETKQIKMSGLC